MKFYFKSVAIPHARVYTETAGSVCFGGKRGISGGMKYLIGIDGGGTATKICVADPDGVIHGHHTAGPLNINGQSREEFRRTIGEILTLPARMGLKPGDCAAIGIGAAGISNPRTREVLEEAFRDSGYSAPVYVYSDGETALAAVFPECHGIILIAGTGSICYGRREDGTVIRSGGYGHLIDDGGSAYDIARRMLAAVVQAEDGRGGATVLKELVYDRLGISGVSELVGYVYAPERRKGDLAALAVLLGRAVAMGDRTAMEIEDACADELCALIRPVLGRLPEEKNVAIGGSVLLKNERIQRKVRDRITAIKDDAWIRAATREASEGAVRLAMRELGR